MAKLDWGELQLQFLSDHAKTGISPKVWCESRGLKYSSAKLYIKIAKRSANSQKKTANKTANSQKGKPQSKEKSPPPARALITENITPEIVSLDIDFFGISDQQAKFAQLIVEGQSRVSAYRDAGYEGTGNAAYVTASQLLRNPKVSRYVHHLRNERQKRYAA